MEGHRGECKCVLYYPWGSYGHPKDIMTMRHTMDVDVVSVLLSVHKKRYIFISTSVQFFEGYSQPFIKLKRMLFNIVKG